MRPRDGRGISYIYVQFIEYLEPPTSLLPLLPVYFAISRRDTDHNPGITAIHSLCHRTWALASVYDVAAHRVYLWG